MLGDMVVLRMQNTEKISRYKYMAYGAAMTGKDAKERTRV